jgi:hypothetical protein
MTPLKKQLTGTKDLARPQNVAHQKAIEAFIGPTMIAIFGPVLGPILTVVISFLIVTVATTAVASALMPKPKMPDMNSSSGLLTNSKVTLAPQEYIYGRVRKGGTITYLESKKVSTKQSGINQKNNFLHMVITIAGHEVDDIEKIYLNDKEVSLTSSGYVTSSPWASGNKYDLLFNLAGAPTNTDFYRDVKYPIRIKTHNGSQTSADSSLKAESKNITSSFIGNGIAYIYMRCNYDEDVFANGIPLVTAVIKGKKIYNPATSTTAWSDNPALCIRDYIVSSSGLGDPNVDETSFAVAKNICDEDINLKKGGVQKRYTLNGVVSSEQQTGDILNQMLSSCIGSLFYGQGKWQLKAGAYVAPIKHLTLDDFRSPIALQTRSSLRDLFNSVQGTFIDTAQDWVSADYPKIESATFIAQDNGIESSIDLKLPFTTDSAMAQRTAKQTLMRSREQITLSAEFGMNAFGVTAGDIVTLTNSRYGWTQKEFEVVSWRFAPSSEAGDLRINLTLHEVSEAAFGWSADEEQEIISNNSELPDFSDVGSVGIEVTSELRVINQAVVGVVTLDLTTDNPFAVMFEVQYKLSSSTEWISVGSSSNTKFEILNIDDGYYDFMARPISGIGFHGDWVQVLDWYVSIFGPPPANVTNFSANVVGNSLHLTWTPVPDLDLSHYKIRYANVTSGGSYQNAIDVVEKVARPANSVTIPAKNGTYFIKAIDKLGNPSVNSTSFVVYTDTANLEGLNVVETITENPSFSGIKTNTVLSEDEQGFYLTLTTDIDFDGLAGLFDEALGLFDGGGGSGIQDNGYYEFANYVDLGDKYVSRVHADMIVDFIDFVNDFDGAIGNFDARLGDFDGDPAQFDTTSAKVQVATTDDDPDVDPTWSAWQDFIVGDLAARAIKFRAVLSTSSETSAPLVRGLTATVDMPDRIEADDDITFTGSQAISFPVPFKRTPAIGVAVTLADGDRYAISSKTRSGFTITVYTGASISTNAVTLDYVAKGYGKELAA